jgi:Cu(I)/Ag(I) efflux system membrane fusion protein
MADERDSLNATSSPTAPASPRLDPPRPEFDRKFFVRIGLNAAAFLAVGLLLIVLLGLFQRVGWIGVERGPEAEAPAASGMEYTCPMHPQIRQPNPGRCPICGMPLELRAEDTGGLQDQYAVTIRPAARRLANIQTAPVESRPMEKTIASIGRIVIDESRQATISAYVAGRIERLFADYTGVEVAHGDHLAVIYSPQLYAAQVEYLESRRALAGMDNAALAAVRRAQDRLVVGARQRLTELGMTAEQLGELDRSDVSQSRMTIYAPIGGTVTQKLVVEGQYVEVGEPIYEIADLTTIWLVLQLYPEDAALVRFGQRVDVDVQSLPGKTFSGRVAFVDPVVDERTRTVDVRVELLNERRLLRPGDYAAARLHVPIGKEGQVFDADLAGKWISPMHPQIIRDEPGACPICGMDLVPTSQYGYTDAPVPQPEVLVVPRRAVLMTGATSLVYVETEPGRFEIRPVTLGPLLRDEAIIVAGVKAGEEVAVSGNFLIDSQMQLAGKPSLIDPMRAKTAKPQAAEGPLEIAADDAQPIAGETGHVLESLYDAYFSLVVSLAADTVPTEAQVAAVEQVAGQLAKANDLPSPLRDHAAVVVESVAHLHHRSLDDARKRFETVSRAILRLAAAARGADATQPFVHYWCEMVPGGKGDWLQNSPPPTNPYWGSQMLRCAQHEQPLQTPLSQPALSPSSRVGE